MKKATGKKITYPKFDGVTLDPPHRKQFDRVASAVKHGFKITKHK